MAGHGQEKPSRGCAREDGWLKRRKEESCESDSRRAERKCPKSGTCKVGEGQDEATSQLASSPGWVARAEGLARTLWSEMPKPARSLPQPTWPNATGAGPEARPIRKPNRHVRRAFAVCAGSRLSLSGAIAWSVESLSQARVCGTLHELGGWLRKVLRPRPAEQPLSAAMTRQDGLGDRLATLVKREPLGKNSQSIRFAESTSKPRPPS